MPLDLTTLPGVFAYWPGTEGSGQRLVNQVTGGDSDQGAWLPSRMFKLASGVQWSGSGVTVTEDYANGPDGTTPTGTRLQGSAGGFLQHAAIFPAGTWTLSCWAKGNGSDQPFTLSYNNASGYTKGPDKTALAAGGYVSFTFTTASDGNQILFWNNAANDPYDIIVDRVRIEPGSSFNQPSAESWGIRLNHQASWSARGITTTGGNQGGVAVAATSKTLTSASLFAVVKQSALASSGYGFIFGEATAGSSFNGFALCARGSGAIMTDGAYFGGQNCAAQWDLYGNGKTHVVGFTAGPTVMRLYQNGLLVGEKAVTNPSVTLRALQVCQWYGSSGYGFDGEFGSGILSDTEWTQQEARDASARLAELATAKGSELLDTTNFLLSEGDSITSGEQVNGDSYHVLAARAAGIMTRKCAVSGSTISTVNARVATLQRSLTGTSNAIYSIMLGANDLAGGASTPADLVAAIKSNCQARLTDGVDKIIVCTCTPNHFATQLAQETFNDLLRGDSFFSTSPVVLCDWQADPTYGTSYFAYAAAADTSKYGDNTHPTADTQAKMGTIFGGYLAPLLASPSTGGGSAWSQYISNVYQSGVWAEGVWSDSV